MALETKKGTLVAPTAVGNQTVTGIPFQPKAVIFWGSGQASGAAAAYNALGFVGMATGAMARCVSAWASNGSAAGVATAIAGRSVRASACIIYLSNGTPTVDAVADFVTFTADGFTVNWTDAPASASTIVHYFAIGGTDVTNAKVTQHTTVRTTAGTEAYTGVGFTPDFLLFVSQSTAADPTGASTCPSFGAVARPSGAMLASSMSDQNAATTMSLAANRSHASALTLMTVGGTTVDADAQLASWDTDGFTLNWTDPPAAAGRVFFSLALKGGFYHAGPVTQRTSAGTTVVDSLATPKGLLFFGKSRTATGVSSALGNVSLAFGACDAALAQGAITYYATDGNTSSFAGRQHSTASVLRALTGTSALSTAADGAVSALNPGSFTLNWTTADANARLATFVVMGDTMVDPPMILTPERPV